jgi:hypothetical protein
VTAQTVLSHNSRVEWGHAVIAGLELHGTVLGVVWGEWERQSVQSARAVQAAQSSGGHNAGAMAKTVGDGLDFVKQLVNRGGGDVLHTITEQTHGAHSNDMPSTPQ